MKVLYDFQIFALQQYGGVSRMFNHLITHICQMENVEVFFFQGFHINRYAIGPWAKEMAFYFGRQVHPRPYIYHLLKPINWALFHRYMQNKPIDIYHPSNYSAAVSRWRKSRVVVTVNDMIPELFPHHFPDIRSRLRVKEACIRRADHIITISHHTKNDLVDYYHIPEEMISVIYAGAPAGLMAPDCFQNPGYWGDHAYFLYVGTRKQEYKNFKRLLLAYASKPEIMEYDLVCFGGPPFTPEERRFMVRLGCDAHVKHVSGDDGCLAAYYRGATAFIYPSLYEGFGLPPLEAMAYQCPVLASKVSALPEILGNAAAYFDPSDPSSMATALETLLADNQLRADLIEKGIKNLKRFCWSTMSEKVYNVYYSISKPEV